MSDNLPQTFLEIAKGGYSWLYCPECREQTEHITYYYTDAKGDQCTRCGDVHNLRERLQSSQDLVK